MKTSKDYLSDNAKERKTSKQWLDELYDQLLMPGKDELEWEYKYTNKGVWMEAKGKEGQTIKLGYGEFDL